MLDAEKVALYRMQDGKSVLEQSLNIQHDRPWPRDLRGRLLQGADRTLDVYLPSVVCHGASNTPASLSCRDSDDPWPIVDGSVASKPFPLSAFFSPTRNFFTGALSASGGKLHAVAPFYSAASLPRGNSVDWLFAGLDGQFRVVSETAERVVRLRWGTDVASIRTACGSGWQVLASSSDEGTSDTVRAYEFPDRDPVPVSAAVEFPGPVSALWTEAKADTAVAVSKNEEQETMKLFVWPWLVATSLLVGSAPAHAETRPQYGGTLRIMMRAAPTSLDPANRTQSESVGRRNVSGLIFDTLITTDESGRVKPALAESWQTSGNRRGQFRIRRNVTFHDGTSLTAEVAASSLRFANPSWKVSVDGETVIVERNESSPDLLAEVALSRNAIARRDPDGKLKGTGSFAIGDWETGKRLTLIAADNCWRGRPFIDSIEIEMGKSFRDQMSALQLGRAELVEVAPEQTHRIAQEGRVLREFFAHRIADAHLFARRVLE